MHVMKTKKVIKQRK